MDNILNYINDKPWLGTICGIIAVIIVLCVIGGIIYGIFLLKRWFNYEFNYESQVIQSLCEIIKPESLKDPSICL